MNREIKFRAWNIKQQKMFDWDILSGAKTEDIWIWFYANKEQNQNKLMQYTGLKDKNGYEIYEGDIVVLDNSKIVVEYGIQGVDAFEGVGFNLWYFYGEQQDGTRLQSEIVIIGNIYETPNLI